ncbi:MAG: hypothetical protein BACD_03834 [Bacteroides rodentium]|jgi:hypothetical protein
MSFPCTTLLFFPISSTFAHFIVNVKEQAYVLQVTYSERITYDT